MTLRSVIDIDVNDETFRSFQSAFERYRTALDKMPQQWRAVNAQVDVTKGSWLEIAAAMLAQAEVMRQIEAEARRLRKTTDDTSRGMSGLVRSVRELPRHLRDATRELVRWSGVTTAITGLIGAGGLFGIERLASSAAGQRRSAMGLGIGVPAQQAFSIFGRLVDPGSFLGNVNRSLYDVTRRWALYGAGMGEGQLRGRDTAQVGAELLARIKQVVDQAPSAQLAQVLQARGLDQFVSLQEAERLRNMRPAEFQGLYRDYQQYQRGLAQTQLSDADLRRWTEFQMKLDLAGRQIQNSLITGLAPLAPELGRLSDAFSGLIAAFLHSDTFKSWVDAATSGLHWLADEVASPGFKKNVDDFIEKMGKETKEFLNDINDMRKGLHKFIDFVKKNVPGGDTDQHAIEGYEGAWNWFTGAMGGSTAGFGMVGNGIRSFFGGGRGSGSVGSVDGAAAAAGARGIVDSARQEGANGSAIAVMLSAAMGEGAVGRNRDFHDPWQVNPISGAAGFWQLLPRSGEMPAYLAAGGKPGDAGAQTRFVLRRLNQIMPGFSTSTNTAAQLDAITRFEGSGQGSGYYGANLNAARQILAADDNPTQSSFLANAARMRTTAAQNPWNMLIGDSIAEGLRRVSGLPGWSRVGAMPDEVLAHIQAMAKAGELAGKSVLLSSGISNNIRMLGRVKDEVEALKAAGARVTLLGVGDRADFDRAALNRFIGGVAKTEGVDFAGPLDNLQGDKVHPRFKPYWNELNQQHVAPATRIEIHNNTGGSASVTANQIPY